MHLSHYFQVPYNIERLFYLAGDQDGMTSKIMQEFENDREAKIPESVLAKVELLKFLLNFLAFLHVKFV